MSTWSPSSATTPAWQPTGWGNGGLLDEENGWHAIAVFEPDAGEIRVRCYRIGALCPTP